MSGIGSIIPLHCITLHVAKWLIALKFNALISLRRVTRYCMVAVLCVTEETCQVFLAILKHSLQNY